MNFLKAAGLFILVSCTSLTALTDCPKFVAHRGGSFDGPENTLVAFERAYEMVARAIEFDCWLTQDHQVVIHHDPSLLRTTKTSDHINNFTLDQLKQCSLLISEFKEAALLPDRLIYNNQPIDPRLILRSLENVNVKLSEKVDEIENKDENPWIKTIKKEFSFSRKEVIYEETYQPCISHLDSGEPIYEGEYVLHSSYEYLGSYQDKHILKTQEYDSSGHGNEIHRLIMVSINENESLEATQIAGGYHWYGVINLIAFENKYVTYTQFLTPNCFMSELTREDMDPSWVEALSYGVDTTYFEVFYQVNLDSLESKIFGLILPDWILEHFKKAQTFPNEVVQELNI